MDRSPFDVQHPARPRLLSRCHEAIEARLQQDIENRGFNQIRTLLRENNPKNTHNFLRAKKSFGFRRTLIFYNDHFFFSLF